jgi:hypothetical protein
MDESELNAKDKTYLSSKFTPLTVRLSEHIAKNKGWTGKLFIPLKFLFYLYFIRRRIFYDDQFGVMVGILAYYAKGRGFDCRTVQTFVCMNMSVCIGSGCFYV